jgi:glycosyltransferase involved in cell wall biosynthesis
VRFAWHRAAVILVNNEETIALLPRRLRRKAVLRPAQCVPRVKPAAPTPSEAPPVAIFGGRLHRFKGLELAIRAVASLPDWRLRLVGDGADAQRLRTLAARLGVASRVEFVPPVPQETLWQLLAAADAFVLPSLKEGGGFAAVEAAALGLPVVAFDQGGPAAIRAYYETDRFHLVPAADGEAGIADALRRLGKRDRTAAPLAATDELVSRDLDLVYGTVRGSR